MITKPKLGYPSGSNRKPMGILSFYRWVWTRADIFWISPGGCTKSLLLTYLAGGSFLSIGILAGPFALSARISGVSRWVAFKRQDKLQRSSSFPQPSGKDLPKRVLRLVRNPRTLRLKISIKISKAFPLPEKKPYVVGSLSQACLKSSTFYYFLFSFTEILYFSLCFYARVVFMLY